MLQNIVCINIHSLSLCPLDLAAKLNFNLYQNTVYSASSKYLFRLRTVVKKSNLLQLSLPLWHVACPWHLIVCSFNDVVKRQLSWSFAHWASEKEKKLTVFAQRENLLVSPWYIELLTVWQPKNKFCQENFQFVLKWSQRSFKLRLKQYNNDFITVHK